MGAEVGAGSLLVELGRCAVGGLADEGGGGKLAGAAGGALDGIFDGKLGKPCSVCGFITGGALQATSIPKMHPKSAGANRREHLGANAVRHNCALWLRCLRRIFMGLILLEALGALLLLVLIVWWTMFSGRKNGELPIAEVKPLSQRNETDKS